MHHSSGINKPHAEKKSLAQFTSVGVCLHEAEKETLTFPLQSPNVLKFS